jgi:hypothetical protein
MGTGFPGRGNTGNVHNFAAQGFGFSRPARFSQTDTQVGVIWYGVTRNSEKT